MGAEDRSGDNILDSKDLEGPSAQKGSSSLYGQDLKKSHLQHSQDRSQDRSPDDEALDKLEDRIRQIEEQLKEVHLEGVKNGGRDFARKRQLESQRRDLRKELIDVAHDHKQILIDKEERDHERAREQEEQRLRQLEEDVRKLRESRRAQTESKEEKEEKVEEKGEKAEEKAGEDLSESRRKARIVELEDELNAEDLRKSRRAVLDYELAALKLSYYPYRSYSSVYPSYRYSYLSPYAHSYYI